MIGLQDEIFSQVQAFFNENDLSEVEDLIKGLTIEETSVDSYRALKERFSDDPKGIKILTCYLKATLLTYDKYVELGIDRDIFIHTMKFYPRFIDECYSKRGYLGFDLGEWSYRFTNLTLIRIGDMEYERKLRDGEKIISMHIPSDSLFSDDAIDRSLSDARKFICEKFPEYSKAPFACESWLLYTGLQDFLSEKSRILAFQKRFEIIEQLPKGEHYLNFIFNKSDCSDYASLPENTSLQRNIKAILLSGKMIDVGYGIIKDI